MNISSTHFVAHIPRRFTHHSWGGTERVLEQTLPFLKEHGFQSGIYTTQAKDDRFLGQIADFPITRYPYFYPEWPLKAERKARYDSKGGDLLSPDLARSLMELEQLSLIHCHTGSLLGVQCLRVARRRKLPIVLTLHGGHFAIPEEELENLAYQGINDPRRGLPWGRVVSLVLRTHNLVQDVDALICVGMDEYEAAKKALPDQRILFLPGGVNLKAFALADRDKGRALLKVAPERPLIVCVARIDRQKDQATLVRAWAQNCSVDCDLALTGPETSPGYMGELRELARGARGRLVLPGGIEPANIPHIYAAGDVSVLPSRHEPFGLACLESWAAGTALVGADVGGPGWLLRGEREGKLFPVGDAAKLGVLLTELLSSPDERSGLIDAGKVRVAEEFSWEKRASRLATIYRSVLELNQEQSQKA